jgi:ABC-type molybdate transport system substrate-binding protein
VLARLIVCAALALVALPTAALADDGEPPAIPVPAADSLMATAHSLAVARWATDPCGGQVTMSWSHMGLGINARSQWMSVDVNDPSTYSDCAITYNLDVDWDWPKLCTVVEHELGHLSGHDHVNDPHDVMSPYYVFAAPECALPKSQAAAAPDRAPRSVASSKRASSAKKPGGKKRKAKAAVKRKSLKKRDAPKRKKRKAHSASLDPRSGFAAASLGGRTGFFGCVLAPR